MGHYHSFRNHYIFNSKTIKSCNCNCRNCWEFLRQIISCNSILKENKETVTVPSHTQFIHIKFPKHFSCKQSVIVQKLIPQEYFSVGMMAIPQKFIQASGKLYTGFSGFRSVISVSELPPQTPSVSLSLSHCDGCRCWLCVFTHAP